MVLSKENQKSTKSPNHKESAVQTMRYPKYKPSGIEWIGEIPEHWEIDRLKWNAILEYGESLAVVDRNDGPIPVFGSNGIAGFHDIAITKSPCIIIGRKGSFGKVNWSNVECFPIDTTYFIDGTKTRNHLRWLFYLLSNLGLDLFSRDTGVPGLNREDAYQNKVPMPPPEEQTAIANYLDDKTSKIDSLIEKKKKLIELLKEERTAIINQAVTRGIDPNIKLKPSGIDWLGGIPKHWEVKKLKYLAKVQSSNVDKKSIEGENSIFLCNYIDVYKNEFIDASFNFMEATATEKEIEKFILQYGDVLITKDSETPDDIAKPAFVTQDFNNVICGYHLAQVRTNTSKLLGEYLFRLFQSKQFNSHFEVSANGVTRFGLPLDSITDVKVCFPSLEEQKVIIQHIETETRRIDTTISKIEKEIELLQEYRTALISEVVTGKIKV